MQSKQKKNKIQWLVRGGLGASLTGFGLCVVIETAFLKHEGTDLWKWLGLGTLGLILFMAGLSVLIDAVRFRIKIDD